MIFPDTVSNIRTLTADFWRAEVRRKWFIDAAQGKEIGHRIADPVDDKTTGLLLKDYEARFQRNKKGEKLPRSMGDIWLKEGEIFHPVNVKSCVTGSGGQPNLVSMKKLLNALLSHQIDAYYLLIVKFEITQPIGVEVHFVDLLDNIEFVTFDSGPGQIMLKARAFYDAQALQAQPTSRPMKDKVAGLVELWEDGERRLFRNRQLGITRIRRQVENYGKIDGHYVTPETQRALNLQ